MGTGAATDGLWCYYYVATSSLFLGLSLFNFDLTFVKFVKLGFN